MSTIDVPTLAIYILAVWRVSSLLVDELGPFSMFERIRRLSIRLRLDGAFSCVWCMSVWVGAVMVLAHVLAPLAAFYGALVLALSAGVIIVHTIQEALNRGE